MVRMSLGIFVIIIFSACQNNTEKKDFHTNGQLKYKYSVIDDSIPHGSFISYYKSGQIKSKGTYFNGHPADTLYRYYVNGKLKEKGILSKDLKTGWWQYFNENGKLRLKEEYMIIRDSMYKNQEIHYLENKKIDLKNSSFFKLNIPDTLPLGKNIVNIEHYVSNFDASEKYLKVVVENEYKKGIIKNDTFSDANFNTSFGIFCRKKGIQIVKGTILEQLLIDNVSDSTLVIKEHYKHFKKEVFVKDTVSN